MISLRDCTVLVNNKAEYKTISKIAKKQGFHWASKRPLDLIVCPLPTRLDFNNCHETRYNASEYDRSRNYTCIELIGGLNKLILARKMKL